MNKLQNRLEKMHTELNEGVPVNMGEYERVKDIKYIMNKKVKNMIFLANVEKKEKDENV